VSSRYVCSELHSCLGQNVRYDSVKWNWNAVDLIRGEAHVHHVFVVAQEPLLDHVVHLNPASYAFGGASQAAVSANDVQVRELMIAVAGISQNSALRRRRSL